MNNKSEKKRKSESLNLDKTNKYPKIGGCQSAGKTKQKENTKDQPLDWNSNSEEFIEYSNKSIRESENFTSSINSKYKEDVRPLIDKIDKLREFGLELHITLPKVVVVGDQSSGKSSIIEALSGIQLPRGKDMVTRCPLELQLKRMLTKPWKASITSPTISNTIETTDPDEVTKIIKDAQDKLCSFPNVSEEVLTLKIESPSECAPDLTLIDLPGIVRTPLYKQSKNICQQIRNIIMNHIKHESTVILCVVSADLDLAVNESINLARSVDPNGERTLGVLTKPDIAVANNVEILPLLRNDKIKLQKGFMMVKCRSLKELGSNLSLEESIRNEEKFFNEDYFKTVNRCQLGTHNLASKITEELVVVIKKYLPSLIEKLESLLNETESKLQNLPKEVPNDKQNRLMYLTIMINDITRELEYCLLKGKVKWSSENQFYNCRNLFEELKNDMEKINKDAFELEFTEKKLTETISKQRGNEIVDFLNFELFESLIVEHISKYKTVAYALLKRMIENVKQNILKIIDNYFQHFPMLKSDLEKISKSEIELSEKIASTRINLHFEEEKVIYTLDSVFQRERELYQEERLVQKKSRGFFGYTLEFTNESSIEKKILHEKTEKMLDIIRSYLKIVLLRLSDKIPMTIRYALHIELCKHLNTKLREYSTSTGIENRVEENQRILTERQNLKQIVERLKKSKIAIEKL